MLLRNRGHRGAVRFPQYSNDPGQPEAIQIREFIRFDDIDPLIDRTLGELATMESPPIRTVFILGRYKDREPGNLKQIMRKYPTLEISYRTMHASKGLTADVVIVTGMNGGIKSFPSEIDDDPLLGIVMPSPEGFQHAEERRLFYVAMTRARHRVYLLVSRMNPSQFIPEVLPYAHRTDAEGYGSKHARGRQLFK